MVIPPEGDVVGEIEYTHPEEGETLAEVGIRFDMGYYAMVNANPHVDPNRPLSAQVRLLIPSQFILPQAPRHGVVINLAEYRLYFFPENDNVVITYPVGIGRKGWSTPVGITKITTMQRNPTWRPTATVIADAAEKGVQMPDVFPSGPSNPLGKHALSLGWPTYLIHGTNRTDGIGERVSAGCIRMLPEDIEYLFGFVKIGTPVRVVNEPLKFGKLNSALYIEVHKPLSEQKDMDFLARVERRLNTKQSLNKSITQEINRPTGVPKKITV